MEDEFSGSLINRKISKLNLSDRIIESNDEIEKLKQKYKDNFINYVHCNGCYRKCFIISSNCGRGKSTYEFYIENEK